MPTENRSSNTEMAAQLSPCPHCGQQDAFVEQLDSDASVVICQGRIDEHSACLARGPVGVQQHECEDQPGHDQAVKEWNKRAATQPHPDPIAWMVGTAFWWTKEEAERDAAASGKTITPFGPMFDTVEVERLKQELLAARAQGRAEVVEMIAQLDAETGLDEFIGSHQIGCSGEWGSHWKEEALREHFGVDPAAAGELELARHSSYEIMLLEEERDTLRAQLAELKKGLESQVVEGLRADTKWLRDELDKALLQLAERDALLHSGSSLMPLGTAKRAEWVLAVQAALSASAEPSAPKDCAICRDLGNQCMECEEGEFREWADRHFAAADYRKTDAGVFIQDWMRHAYGAWCARAALERKPQVKS